MKKIIIVLLLFFVIPVYASDISVQSTCPSNVNRICVDTDDNKICKGNGSTCDEILTSESDPIVAAQTNGFTITRGTTPATLTVSGSATISGTPLISLSGAVLTDQTTPQTIGATGTRLTKLWATDATFTNLPSMPLTQYYIWQGNSSGIAAPVSSLSISSITDGVLYKGTSATYGVIFDTSLIGTSDKTFVWPNVAGTLCATNSVCSGYQASLTYPVTGVASPTAGYLTKWHTSGNAIVDGPKIGTFTDAKWCSYTSASGLECTQNTPSGGGYSTVDNEGTPLTQRSIIDFIGAGVNCVDNNSHTECTISGGTGSGTVTAGVQYSIPFYSAADGGTTLDDVAGLKTNAYGTLLETVKDTGVDYITLRQGTTGGETTGFVFQASGAATANSFTAILPDADAAEPTAGQVLIFGTPSGHISQMSYGGPYQGILTNSAGLLSALNDETGTGISVFNDSPTFVDDITIHSAGVKITGDGDGAVTFLGLGNGYDEDLTINLDDTENEATVSSSTGVIQINYGSIKQITTGAMQGGMNIIGTFASPITSTGAYTLTAVNSYGSVLFYNDTDAVQLVAAVAGMNFCIYITSTNILTVEPYSNDIIVLNGTALTAGHNFTLTAAAGNYVCMFSDAANHWITLGFKGTLADGS